MVKDDYFYLYFHIQLGFRNYKMQVGDKNLRLPCKLLELDSYPGGTRQDVLLKQIIAQNASCLGSQISCIFSSQTTTLDLNHSQLCKATTGGTLPSFTPTVRP